MTGESINECDMLVINISLVWYGMYLHDTHDLQYVSSFMKIRISDTMQESLPTLGKNMLKFCGHMYN